VKMIDYAEFKETPMEKQSFLADSFLGYVGYEDAAKELKISKQAAWKAIQRGTLAAKVVPVTEKITLIFVHRNSIKAYKRRQAFFRSHTKRKKG